MVNTTSWVCADPGAAMTDLYSSALRCRDVWAYAVFTFPETPSPEEVARQEFDDWLGHYEVFHET